MSELSIVKVEYTNSDLLIGEDVYNSGWERYAMAHNREIMTAGMRQRGSFLQGATMRRSLVVWQSLGSRHNSVEGTVLPMTDEEKGNSNEFQRYTSLIVSLPEYIGFDRNGSPVIDLHRLLVYSHIKMIVIVSLLFAFLQDKELNRMNIEASASET